MRPAPLPAALCTVLLVAVLALAGCSAPESSTTPPAETPKASQLDAAIATATKAVSDASVYIMSLKQALPDATSNDDLEKLQSTLNLAATQTGATQIATSQSALDQFNAGIEKTTASAASASQDASTQDQFEQLIITLEIGRDALDAALE